MATDTALTADRGGDRLDPIERSRSSGRAVMFLALAIVGLIGQIAIVAALLADRGFDLGEFADQTFASTVAALTFADLMMSAVVFLAWMPREAARVGMRWWPFALATLGGLCFAFPLFLYARERKRSASQLASP